MSKMIVVGLVLSKSNNGSLLQYAATSSFLNKLYNDNIDHPRISGARCENDEFSVVMLQYFATSQANLQPYEFLPFCM